ncbi:hypothetical protein TNIN_181891 [Trichonephila inaurata madagascariensis]|uniref:Uncharacterized protein n=1 Tax=Trichonephila inaurata madagascariensis TaxID=2747483 RepID=A0A8X6XTN1_9ARAC|nr:hypothetical protein TNIN_181891 [Trichonephila inaurata madagascariensis]
MTGLKADQGDRRMTVTDKRKPHVGSKESSPQISNHPEDRLRTKGDQSGPEKDARNPDPTTKSTDTSSSLHARVVRSRNRSPGVDEQAVRVQEEAEKPNSNSARKWEENPPAKGRRRWKL